MTCPPSEVPFAITQIDAHSRQTQRDNTLLQHYVVKETTGNNEINKDEMRKLLYSTSDQVINKIDVRCDICHE